MAAEESNTHPDPLFGEHLDLAAFHLYESGRAYDPERPSWDSDAAGSLRTSTRYITRMAHRRGMPSTTLVAIERLAVAFALADGEVWPDCTRGLHAIPEPQRKAMSASRRQRYRHLARIAHAELMNYYELGQEDERMRGDIIHQAMRQHHEDTKAKVAWRDYVMPSTVTQIHRESGE